MWLDESTEEPGGLRRRVPGGLLDESLLGDEDRSGRGGDSHVSWGSPPGGRRPCTKTRLPLTEVSSTHYSDSVRVTYPHKASTNVLPLHGKGVEGVLVGAPVQSQDTTGGLECPALDDRRGRVVTTTQGPFQ